MTDFIAWLADPFQYQFVKRALVMALLLGVSGGLVGAVLLLRRIVLMADSFGHALLPGIGFAFLLFGAGLASLFTGALVSGIIAVVISGVVHRLTRLKEDAAFGALFTICFAVGVALMSRVAAPTDLLHYLFGNILGVTAADLWLVCAVACTTLLAVAVGYRALLLESYDPVFHRAAGGRSALTHGLILALVVLNLVAALQAVGMVLALGLFVLPAVTAYLWCERFGAMLLLSAAVGGIGAGVGLLVSYHANLPSGACMVGCLGAVTIASIVASPRHGMIARLRHPPQHRDGDSDRMCSH